MPGTTTPGGLPYPLPTEPIANGADAIKNLATAIDARPFCIANGSLTLGTAQASYPLTAVEDAKGMVSGTRVTIPAGYGGLWWIAVRVFQSGTGAITLNVRKNGVDLVLADARTGAAGAAATPLVSAPVRLNAADYIEVRAAVASGTLATSFQAPLLTVMWMHA